MARNPEPTHKHQALREQMIAALRAGEWQTGERLPGSRQLAARFGASPNTLERVLRDLTETGYVERRERSGSYVAEPRDWGKPQRPAGTLIGVLGALPPPLFAALNATLSAAGAGAVVRVVGDSPAAALAAAEDLTRQQVRGFLWSPLSTPRHDEDNTRLALALMRRGPAVAVDRYLRGLEIDCVVSDNARAAYELTQGLLELGHRRIGLVRHQHGSTPEDRHQGYSRALAEAGGLPECVLTVPHELPADELVLRLRAWLRTDRPTAAWSICGNPLGAALLASAQAEGLRVPDDLSIATFDELVAPLPVRSVIQPLAEIGRRAAELLLERINHPERAEIQRIVLPSILRAGASCRPPAGAGA